MNYNEEEDFLSELILSFASLLPNFPETNEGLAEAYNDLLVSYGIEPDSDVSDMLISAIDEMAEAFLDEAATNGVITFPDDADDDDDSAWHVRAFLNCLLGGGKGGSSTADRNYVCDIRNIRKRSDPFNNVAQDGVRVFPRKRFRFGHGTNDEERALPATPLQESLLRPPKHNYVATAAFQAPGLIATGLPSNSPLTTWKAKEQLLNEHQQTFGRMRGRK